MEVPSTEFSRDQPEILQSTRFERIRQCNTKQPRNTPIPAPVNRNEGSTDRIHKSTKTSGAKSEGTTSSKNENTRPWSAPSELKSLGNDYSIHNIETQNNFKASSILTKHAETVSTATVSYHDDEVENMEANCSSFWGNNDDATHEESVHAALLNCATPYQNQGLDEEDDHSPSPLPFAISTDSLINLQSQGDEWGHDKTSSRQLPLGHHSPSCWDESQEQLPPWQLASRGESSTISSPMTHEPQQHLDVNNEGLASLHGTEDYDNNSQDNCPDDDGIVILNPSTEEEIAETMNAVFKRSYHGDDRGNRRETNQCSISAYDNGIIFTSPVENDLIRPPCRQSIAMPSSASTFGDDSIILAAAADLSSPSTPNRGERGKMGDSLDFHQLMREAECGAADLRRTSEIEYDHSPQSNHSEHKNCISTEDPTSDSMHISRSSGTRMRSSHHSAANSFTRSTYAPIRANRIHDDKFIVEMDVFSPNHASSNSRLGVRDAIDIIANIELLHLWFEPIQAVFDASVKDGSSSSISPQSSPTSSQSSEVDVENASNDRQYDGEWIEVSTPLLVIPKDARVSGCLRSIRVGFRSLVGFPARIRSIVFVERRRGRIGMTLGPFPDRFVKGTMAYHTFYVRAVEDESGQRIVISDEVRLQRDGDDCGDRFDCRYCFIFRLLFMSIEWFLFRWYQPDLASFMSQTMSSFMKLRDLIERGETMAYAGGNIATAQNFIEERNLDDVISAPLLG